MKYIIKGRREGKTYDIVQECLAHEGVLVVFYEKERDRLKKEYPNLIVISASETQKLEGINRPRIFVDNAEFILQDRLGPINTITLNRD